MDIKSVSFPVGTLFFLFLILQLLEINLELLKTGTGDPAMFSW